MQKKANIRLKWTVTKSIKAIFTAIGEDPVGPKTQLIQNHFIPTEPVPANPAGEKNW